MSGPKGASYTVVSAAEIERRAVVGARAQWDAQLRRCAAFEERCRSDAGAYGVSVTVPAWPAVAEGASSSTVKAAVGSLSAALDRAEAVHRDRVGGARAAGVARGMAELFGDLGDRMEAELARSNALAAEQRAARRIVEAVPDTRGERRARLVTRVEATLARLDPDTPEIERARIESLARDVLAAASERGTLLAGALSDAVRAASCAALAGRERNQVIDELVGRVRGVETATDTYEATALLARLEGARRDDRSELGALRVQVEGLEVTAARARDREFAMDVAMRCLQDMGYEAEAGFDTLVAGGGSGLLRRAGWPGYAVQMRATPGSGELGFNVVRMDDGPPDVRDGEVESEWCGDYAELQRAAGGRGLDLRLTRAAAPGALPLQRVRGVRGADRRTSVEQPRRRSRAVGGQS